MPQTCIVKYCGSRSNRDKLSFFSVPAVLHHKFQDHMNKLSVERRNRWLAAIDRDDLTSTKLKYQKVCSKHFVSGKPAGLTDISDPDWVPSLSMGDALVRLSKRKPGGTYRKGVESQKLQEIEFVDVKIEVFND